MQTPHLFSGDAPGSIVLQQGRYAIDDDAVVKKTRAVKTTLCLVKLVEDVLVDLKRSHSPDLFYFRKLLQLWLIMFYRSYN